MRQLAAALLLAASAAAAAAQETSPAETPPNPNLPEDRIVVIGQMPEGQNLREYVSDFVAEVARPVGNSGNFGYARWDGRICVGVENIARDAAQYIADRISQVALEVGLRPGEPGCAPNIAIVFSVDGAALATYLAESEPSMFRPFAGTGGTMHGLHALEEFTTSDAAVRWWQISMVVDWAGNIAIELPNLGHLPPCYGEVRICVSGSNSRITNAVRDELWAAYVIVDVTKLDGANWGQMADYLAMVSLAQIAPDADATGYDTILNLFHTQSRAYGMTDWDRAYLQALYEFEPHRMPEQQRGAITREFVRQYEGE